VRGPYRSSSHIYTSSRHGCRPRGKLARLTLPASSAPGASQQRTVGGSVEPGI
jgi:hypothetical protein